MAVRRRFQSSCLCTITAHTFSSASKVWKIQIEIENSGDAIFHLIDNALIHGSAPAISVIVPLYNYSTYIQQCLKSLEDSDRNREQWRRDFPPHRQRTDSGQCAGDFSHRASVQLQHIHSAVPQKSGRFRSKSRTVATRFSTSSTTH